jgi:hypothetical protein
MPELFNDYSIHDCKIAVHDRDLYAKTRSGWDKHGPSIT